MERTFLLLALWVFNFCFIVSGNVEGDALSALKNAVTDPTGVLTSWDASLVNPCTWFHITCNNDNLVTRVDLGNANLTGQLVPQLGLLPNLQYLELYSNHINGTIPPELGNLTNLVSLDLYQNKLSGSMPDSLGKLSKLRFLRLNNNTLSGVIPNSLTTVYTLQVLAGICQPIIYQELYSLLVYPYMPNGSVASCLRERKETQPPLDWPKRKRIALGSARGLTYLHEHCNPKIIHRDVKAANILLDGEFEAIVGDFGLAKLMNYKDTHVTTAVRGTIGYISPEYISTGKSSEKTDVFGYGVMLLELITGQRAFDLARLANNDDDVLLDWVKGLLKDKKFELLVDADLQGDYTQEEVEGLIQIALLCTQSSPMDRPKMSEVVRMLEGEGLAERWELLQKEDMFRHEFNLNNLPNGDFVFDSTHHLPNDELSGPR